MPNRSPMHLSPSERDVLAERLQSELRVAEDAEDQRRNVARAAVLLRINLLSFEGCVIYGESAIVLLSSDEAEIALDSLGPPTPALDGLFHRIAGLHRRLLAVSRVAAAASTDSAFTHTS